MATQHKDKGLPRLWQLNERNARIVMYSFKALQKLYASKYPDFHVAFWFSLLNWKLETKVFLEKEFTLLALRMDLRILELISAKMFLYYTERSAAFSVVILWQLWRIVLIDHFRLLCGDAVVVYKCFVSAVSLGSSTEGRPLAVDWDQGGA